jgi:NDP-hexose-3-ketoreductase
VLTATAPQESRTSGRVLAVGVMGCADIARRRVLPAFTTEPSIRVAAIASRDAATARRFAARFGGEPVDGYAELLARTDLDAVYIPLPAGLHGTWIARALRAGKHVLAEKPLALRYREAADLLALAAERGLVLMENMTFVHHSQHAAVRDLLAAGAIGELRAVTAAFGIPPLPAGDIRYRTDLGGEALSEVGVYPIQAARMFLGDELEVAGAWSRRAPGSSVETAGGALLATPEGAVAHLTYGFEHGYRSAYELWGSTGRIVLERAFSPPAGLQPTVHVHTQDRVESRTLPADDQFATMVALFARTVLAGDRGPDPTDTLDRAALVDRIRAVAGGGR